MSEAQATATLPALSDVLRQVERAFTDRGALGVIAIDGAGLAPIERRYGDAAHRQALANVAQHVHGACEELRLGEPPLVAAGELGRGHVIVLIAHSADDASFFLRVLPALTKALLERLERARGRIGYPYLRQVPSLAVGRSVVLRNPLLGAMSQTRRALEEALHDAQLCAEMARRERRDRFLDLLLNRRVYSVYEPVVDARALTVFGYEALVRGQSGSGFASPGEMFAAAEAEDLIFEFDCLCRQKAIEGAVDFPAGAKLFMNIRPTSIHDPSFQPDALKRTLEQCGLGPADVVFEISEQESIENYVIFREARDEYGKLGFQFALDDTGAGYASLEAVMELQPEFIKVDRAFVRGIDEDVARQNMVRAFRAVADRMNARIIGEGLDTLEELRTLGDLGIDFGQGWLFGKPTPLRA